MTVWSVAGKGTAAFPFAAPAHAAVTSGAAWDDAAASAGADQKTAAQGPRPGTMPDI